MFEIQLMQNLSATNVVDKDVAVLDNPNGTLRQGTSIIDPVIIIHCSATDTWRKLCNYAYIPAFNRYYYVTNIIAVAGSADFPGADNPTQLWEFHMHVDVLMSYKEGIRAQTAIVARQEAAYNLMLDDGIFMCYQNPKIQTKLFSNPTPFETQEFVLVVAGS